MVLQPDGWRRGRRALLPRGPVDALVGHWLQPLRVKCGHRPPCRSGWHWRVFWARRWALRVERGVHPHRPGVVLRPAVPRLRDLHGAGVPGEAFQQGLPEFLFDPLVGVRFLHQDHGDALRRRGGAGGSVRLQHVAVLCRPSGPHGDVHVFRWARGRALHGSLAGRGAPVRHLRAPVLRSRRGRRLARPGGQAAGRLLSPGQAAERPRLSLAGLPPGHAHQLDLVLVHRPGHGAEGAGDQQASRRTARLRAGGVAQDPADVLDGLAWDDRDGALPRRGVRRHGQRVRRAGR
mmetsp:Transcript_126296/g.338856  ORF Transcript_126296/g.338856 Transcript_126296/m.338856 type:complete len:291 (-) Transcript_126296:959-1831(-)